MWLLLLALVFVVLVPAAAAVYAFRGGLTAYRDFKRMTGALAAATGELSEKLERVASFEPPDLDRVSGSVERLQHDRARLSILLGALGRAREQFSAFATVYPKK